MKAAEGGAGAFTLEDLLEGVRDGVEHAGWVLSGLQKTTSTEFEGRWAGDSTRSAYLFFHRPDLPEAVSLEAFLDESSRGLKGNVSLVVEGPELGGVGPIPPFLSRVAGAARDTLPEGYRTPLTLRLALRDSGENPDEASIQFRFKLPFPRTAVEAGRSAISALSSAGVTAFEQLLERPEVAELLPPVVE